MRDDNNGYSFDGGETKISVVTCTARKRFHLTFGGSEGKGVPQVGLNDMFFTIPERQKATGKRSVAVRESKSTFDVCNQIPAWGTAYNSLEPYLKKIIALYKHLERDLHVRLEDGSSLESLFSADSISRLRLESPITMKGKDFTTLGAALDFLTDGSKWIV